MNRRTILGASLRALGLSALPAVAQQRDPASLKITRVEPYLLRIGERTTYPTVRIETAEGIHGWGEGTSPPSSPAILAQIRECAKVVMGQSAWDTERLWRQMYILEENTLGGTFFAAMSAIDIALWDIIGKKLNVPVHDLLGGRTREKIRIYSSYRWGNIQRTRESYLARTKQLIAEGATAGKYDPFGAYPGFDRQLSTPVLNEVREMIRGIREAGPAFDICVECHGKFNLASAGRIIKMLEPFDPFFVEEPVPPENVEAMVTLQRSTNIPIATGEGLQSHFNYSALLDKQAARIIQPDVSRTGGITAMKKIVAMADAHYVTFAPHNPNGPVCTAASMHVAAASPNFLIMEEGKSDTKDYNDIFKGGWKTNLAEWPLPEGPGLGVDFSPAFIKERAMKLI